MSQASVGPGGGQVGPGGGKVGPDSTVTLAPPSGIITLSGGVPTAPVVMDVPTGVITLSATTPTISGQARAMVGPGGGRVGPGGGEVGPAAGSGITRFPPSGVIRLSSGTFASPVSGGLIRLVSPNPDQSPLDDSWARGLGNPIIEATEVWEGTAVRGLRVIQSGGFYRGWYSATPGIGYASCPDTDDPTDPLNWTKYAGNPIVADGTLPSVIFRSGLYRMMYVDASGDLQMVTSVDGFTGWSAPALALDRLTGVDAPSVTVDSVDVLDTGATPQDWHGRASLLKRLDGSWIRVSRDGSAHAVNDGALHIAYSNDDMVTWSLKDKHLDTSAVGNFPMNPPGLIAGEDAGEPLLVRFPNGDIGLLMWKSDYGVTANGTYMSRSTDDGDTFGIPAGPLSFPGFGGTSDTDLRTFATDQGFIDDAGDFYMGARIYPSHTSQSPSGLTLVKTTNNGTTWARVCANIVAITENGGTGGQEVGLTQVGPTRFLAMIRDNPQTKSFRRFSDDKGLTWGTLEDVTSTVGIAGRQRVYTFAQLRGEANWWLDPKLIMTGFEATIPGNSQSRRNCVWLSPDSGANWTKYPIDLTMPGVGGDGGYGDIAWSPSDGRFKVVSYRGSLTAASLVQYNLTVDDGFIDTWASRDIWSDTGGWKMLVAGIGMTGRSHMYYATSPDGDAWTLQRAGQRYASLQVHPDGTVNGPHVEVVDNRIHVWYHAAPVAGNLTTDIYHASTLDATADAWTTPTLVFAHSGTDFEIDSVSRPDILIGTGPAIGVAFLFYDGGDHGLGTAAIGVAVSASIGGITTVLGFGDLITSTIHLPFDIGAITSTIRLLFTFEGPPLTSTIHLPFEFRGAIRSTIHLPFDILGPLTSTIRLPFDILSVPRVNEIQIIHSGGVVTSYVLTFDGQPTASILGTANAAAVQAALILLSNLAPGDVTVTGGPLNTTDLTITFGGAYAGLDVPQITVVATGIVDQSPVGSTTQNGGPVSTGGGQARGVPDLWRPLMVFDKAGTYLGSIGSGRFNVINPPVRYLRSRRVQTEGGMTFSVSRHSSDFGLIASDRLVRLQSLRGEKPWWGTISPQADAGGTEQVTCKDGYTLLRDGLAITIPPQGSTDTSEEVNDGTPATAIYAKIMALHNDLRASTGEVQWELDLQGSRPFRGDLTLDTDTLSALDMIIGRSRTEIAIDSRLEGNRLVPILRVRDTFDAGAGADIFDGPDGNVTSGVTVITDPTPLVFSIRLNGLQTDLAKCLPQWAQWALLDITPTVTVSVDPGDFRNRQVLDENVDWGLSHAAVNAQCNAILDWLWALYRTYLMALHDIEGRPNHTGWAYLGPPDIYEPKSAGKDSLSRRAWTNRLQLVELRTDEPASAVMISESHAQINLREWLVVRYNRVSGAQTVTVWAIETAAGLELIKWNLTGSATLYQVSGDRVIGRSTITTTGAFVDPYNTRIYDPQHISNGHVVPGRYRNLRRIINGPFALAYYIDPADADNALVDLGVDAALSTTSGDGTSLISKMYDFERFAIENWDPRRDGIGARLARPTIFFGSETTRPRWHVVSFDVGGDASTALTHGIGASAPGVANDIEVDSNFGFPDPDLEPGSFPFLATIDDGMDQEQILVISMLGTTWHVLRGQGGTDAIIHEAGAPVKMFGAKAWPGFPFPYTWPEGEEWATAEIAELSKQRINLDVHIAHFRDDQLTIDYGSTHAIDVATEGPPGRWTGSGRVIGWSTDPGYSPDVDDPTPPGGETQVVLEWTQ